MSGSINVLLVVDPVAVTRDDIDEDHDLYDTIQITSNTSKGIKE